jgi:hypothetical protein
VAGWTVFLCGALVSTKSKMLHAVSLSVTEAELFLGCNCMQDMMFVLHILESLGLKVKLPMMLQMDNKGAINLVNNWSSAGRGTFATCIPNESGLAGDVLLLLLLIPKGLGPEPDEVVVQVLQKTFCRPLHKGNYLSVITTVNLINVT